EPQSRGSRRLHSALGYHPPTPVDRRGRLGAAAKHDALDRGQALELFRIDYRRAPVERHRTAGVARTAAARNDGKPELDAAAHQSRHLRFGIRMQDDEWVLDAPVGRVGDVTDAGEAVEGDVVRLRMAREHSQRALAQIPRFPESGCETIDRRVRGGEQSADLGIACGTRAELPPLFDLAQTMPERADQKLAAGGVVE